MQNLRDVLPSINSKLAEAAPNMHKGEHDARDEVVKIIAGSSLSLAPTELCCPITHELYTDPVNASDGETYERSAIERWIKGKTEIVEAAKKEIEETKGESERALRSVASGIVSPMGHGTLKSLALTPARAMKRMADDWRRDFEMRTTSHKALAAQYCPMPSPFILIHASRCGNGRFLFSWISKPARCFVFWGG